MCANPDEDVIIGALKQQVGYCDPLCGTDPDGSPSSIPGITVGSLVLPRMAGDVDGADAEFPRDASVKKLILK